MDAAPTLTSELWRPPHLAAAAGGREVEASSAVTGNSNGSRGGGAGRRRQRESPASDDESSRLVSTSGGGGGQDLTDSEVKRFKAIKSSGDDGSLRTEADADSRNASKAVDQNPLPAEPPKQDYIHVRARRGQATDSHSLAERARREKISERMKILQDLVPGCNKVIGKASVLDEIINYIQALQRQVEFLSMKLEAVNAHVNNGVEAFPSKDVFRPLLNIAVEFTAEELEDAIIMPNSTLDDVHMHLLKSIPPVTRMAMGHGTWVTVLCRKLKDWWHWVAEGDIPIVASHGAEIEMYKALEPATRLVILKAICDIRGEQEDVRNYIDNSLKHGYQLPTFRKERIGGDSYGISYWYEEDPILGHRLYREIRQVEYVKEPPKKSKVKGVSSVPVVSYQWETVASKFNEFEAAAEKLFSSRNRTEVSLGKKLKINYLPEIEKIHKKKERQLKKQQREALLLDSYLTVNGFTSSRPRRERKRATYTFDDYDRSINEAIKTTKKSDNFVEIVTTNNRRVHDPTREASSNGMLSGPSPVCNGFHGEYPPNSYSYQASDGEEKAETLHRSYRQRKRSQRYTQDFVEAVSDIEPSFDSDDDIIGEAVYDEEYLRSRKQRKASPSEDDDEFRLEQIPIDDVDEGEYSLSSEDEKEPQRYKRLPTRSPRGIKLRTVDEIQIGIRHSKRSTCPHINYQQYDLFGTDAELGKPGKSNASDPDAGSDALHDMEISTSQDQEEEKDEVNKERSRLRIEKLHVPGKENKSVGRRPLDLNELAPVGVFDDAPVLMVKDKHMNNS